MSEIPLTTPRKELPPQGREEWDALREVRVSPEEAKIISKVAEYILRRASDAGMEKADFFKNPAFKELTEKQISSALETARSEEHTSELQSLFNLVCRLLLEKKNL